MDIKDLIEGFVSYNEQEEQDKKVMLLHIDTFEDVLTRENVIGHFTSSAFIVNKNRDKVLFIYHNIYNSWCWVGGHADGDSDFLHVALKETEEETGLKNVKPISTAPISLEILSVFGHVKRGKYVSDHVHLNLAYLLEADEEEVTRIKADENSGVEWISFDDIANKISAPHMLPIYEKIISKTRKLNL